MSEPVTVVEGVALAPCSFCGKALKQVWSSTARICKACTVKAFDLLAEYDGAAALWDALPNECRERIEDAMHYGATGIDEPELAERDTLVDLEKPEPESPSVADVDQIARRWGAQELDETAGNHVLTVLVAIKAKHMARLAASGDTDAMLDMAGEVGLCLHTLCSYFELSLEACMAEHARKRGVSA